MRGTLGSATEGKRSKIKHQIRGTTGDVGGDPDAKVCRSRKILRRHFLTSGCALKRQAEIVQDVRRENVGPAEGDEEIAEIRVTGKTGHIGEGVGIKEVQA